MSPSTFGMGSHDVDLECPDCGAVLPTVMTLGATLTHSTDDKPRLKLKVTNNKALEHLCNSDGGDEAGTPAMFDAPGDPVSAPDPFGADPFGGR